MSFPFTADRPLDVQRVRDALAQFDDLAPAEPVLLGRGWDHDAYLYGVHVFRFPRRSNVVPFVQRERRLLPHINAAVTIETPVVTHVGEPTAAFPYPFLGYRHVAGEAGHDESIVDVDAFAVTLGQTLAELHAIDLDAVPADPSDGRTTPAEALSVFTKKRDLLRELIPEDIAEYWAPYFAGEIAPPPPPPRPCFVHGDCNPEHFIFDADGQAIGMIDFTDARSGDPAGDFVIGHYFFGEAFTDAALQVYEQAGGFVDDMLQARVRFDADVSPLEWLCEAIEYDAEQHNAQPDAIDNFGHVAKHQRWLTRHVGNVRRADRLGR